jgi:primosomal protein N' (replication factor Y)
MMKSKNCGGAPRQAELLEVILDWKRLCAADLLRQTALDNQTLRALVKRGLAELREEAVVRDPHADEQFIATSNLILNPEQLLALKEIAQALDRRKVRDQFCSMGSRAAAKSEIYLQAIRATLERGRSAIVLVPEISLTPQTV